jgi:ATP-dependent protease HslVU (ClpYQ) peptidase subunit
MTTLAVCRKDGVAAIGADTLTKWGATKESAKYVANHSKFVEVGGTLIAVTGYTTFILILRDYFAQNAVEADFSGVDAIFRTWQTFHGALKEHYFLQPGEDKEDDVESSQLEVVIANPHGIFGVSQHRSVQEFSRFYAYGGGADLALGAMYGVYDSPLSAREIVTRGIEAAAEFDDRTGLPAEVRTVRLTAA